ncbi:hypothetical protein PAUR_a1737 [Pseudoalteromonas aurantia 208]|uniref:Orphan protein n=1 Tax=Pseudoalteromonas aurantia 208 TaxID=1314867 RepID=A0ABR9EB05_9GAMM|nr:hypothetical protein [Pseudoalteromonas aurantia 208]
MLGSFPYHLSFLLHCFVLQTSQKHFSLPNAGFKSSSQVVVSSYFAKNGHCTQ